MDEQKANLYHEIQGKTKSDTERSSSDGKQIVSEYFVSKTIKYEQIDIKSEEGEGEGNHFSTDVFNDEKQIEGEYFISTTIKHEETDIKNEEEEVGDQFSTDDFNENEIQDDYFDSKSIKEEDIEIKSENEEMYEFSTESLVVKSEIGFHLADKGANVEELPTFKCLKCNYQTLDEQLIKSHVNSHIPKPFKCSLCPYKSNKKDSLRQHRLVHIPKEEAKLFKCSECPDTFKWKNVLNRHLLTHKKPDQITWHHCPQCPYKTKHERSLLYRHMKKHKEDKPMYKCTLCSYQSCAKYNIKLHSERVHKANDLPLITCPEEGCMYKTHLQLYLQQHIRNRHHCQGEFKCSECPFQAKNMATLKKHELKHQNRDKWFSCSLCPYKTPYKSVLNAHALVHKSASEITWFQCSDCSFRTKRVQGLRNHKLKHSSKTMECTSWLHCYVCTWRTVYKRNLANHIQTMHRDAEGRIRGNL